MTERIDRIAIECELLSQAGRLEARLDEFDLASPKQRIFVMGCGRSGTWLLIGIMSTFCGVATVSKEVPVELFGLLESPKHTLVMKRNMRSYETVENIPSRVSIIYIVRHPFDVLTSFNKTTGRKYHISPARWLGEMMSLQFLAETQRDATKIIRYEDLVGDPVGMQKELGAFFHLETEVSAHDFLRTFRPPQEATAAMHGLRPIDSQSIGRWKNKPEDISYLIGIRRRLGPMLDWVSSTYDYDITLPPV